MMETLLQGLAIALAITIFVRAVCVVHGASPRNHQSRARFLAFGYSYVTLGAGAVFAAIELCNAVDLGGLPLWLMLAGSCGLIAFDRRMARCWAASDCPATREGRK